MLQKLKKKKEDKSPWIMSWRLIKDYVMLCQDHIPKRLKKKMYY